jgi:hypothetical protein
MAQLWPTWQPQTQHAAANLLTLWQLDRVDAESAVDKATATEASEEASVEALTDTNQAVGTQGDAESVA